jgi:hypothetical protein
MFRNCFSAIWIAIVIVASAWSQQTVGAMVIYGQVSAGDSPLAGWIVQLAHLGDGETRSAELFWNGAFEFHQVPIGEHRLRVIDAGGHVQHDEVVSLRRDGETLAIRLRPDDAAPRGPGGDDLRAATEPQKPAQSSE